MEPCSAEALNAHQKMWQMSLRLCCPSQPRKSGLYFLEAEVSPLLSPAMAQLYNHLLQLQLAVIIEPADWRETAHGEGVF